MKKIGLIFDSSCNFRKEELNKKGIGFIPLMMNIDGKDYRGGIDITSEEVSEKMKLNKNIKIFTSSPMPRDIMSAYDWALERYDEVLYIGMSEKFSSTITLAKRIAKSTEKYLNKVHVFESKYSAPWTEIIVDDAFEYLKTTENLNDLIEILNKHQETIWGWMSPGNIIHFYNGGRITKMQYLTSSLLKIKPILTVTNGHILENEIIKVRTQKNVIKKIIKKYYFWKEKFNFDENEIRCLMIKTGNDKLDEEIIDQIKSELKWVKTENIKLTFLSSEQTAHMGPESIGISYFIPLKYFFGKNIKKENLN